MSIYIHVAPSTERHRSKGREAHRLAGPDGSAIAPPSKKGGIELDLGENASRSK